jgi:hypothetical protein
VLNRFLPQVTEAGVLSGLALWFQLILDREETLVIDTKPGEGRPLH